MTKESKKQCFGIYNNLYSHQLTTEKCFRLQETLKKKLKKEVKFIKTDFRKNSKVN